MIQFPCPSCGAKFQGKDESAGRRFKCPKCAHEFRVPGVSATKGAAQGKELEPIFEDEPVELDLGAFAEALAEVSPSPAAKAPALSRPAPTAVSGAAATVATTVDMAKRKRMIMAGSIGGGVLLVAVLAVVMSSGSGDPAPAGPGDNNNNANPHTPPVAVVPPGPDPVPAPSPDPVPKVDPPVEPPKPEPPKPVTVEAAQLRDQYIAKAIEAAAVNSGRPVDSHRVLCEIAQWQSALNQPDAAKATYERAAKIANVAADKTASFASSIFATTDRQLWAWAMEQLWAKWDLAGPAEVNPAVFCLAAEALTRAGDTEGVKAMITQLRSDSRKNRPARLVAAAMIHAVAQDDHANAATVLADLPATVPGVSGDYRDKARAEIAMLLLERGKADRAGKILALATDREGQAAAMAAKFNGLRYSPALVTTLVNWQEGQSIVNNQQFFAPARNLYFLELVLRGGHHARGLEYIEALTGAPNVYNLPGYGEAMARSGRLAELSVIADPPAVQGGAAVGQIYARAGLLASIAVWSKLLGDDAKHAANIERMDKASQATDVSPELANEMSAHLALAHFRLGDEAAARRVMARVKAPQSPSFNMFLWADYNLMSARLGELDLPMTIAAKLKNQTVPPVVRMFEGLALSQLEKGSVGWAMSAAFSVEDEMLDHVTRLAVARAGAEEVAGHITRLGPAQVRQAAAFLAIAKAAHDPAAPKFLDPRPRPIDKASLAGLAVKPPADQQDSVKQWIAMLGDANATTRERACALLKGAGGDAWTALPVLTKAYHSDSSRKVQAEAWTAIDAILKLTPGKFVIRKPTVEVFTAVLGACGSSGSYQSRQTAVQCFEALAVLAEPAVLDAVLPQMAALVRPPGHGDTLLEITDKASPAAAPQLARGITQPDATLGIGCASILVRLSFTHDVSATFTELVADPNPVIRERLVPVLNHVYFTKPQTMASLLPLLKDRDPEVRSLVVEKMKNVLMGFPQQPWLKGLDTAVPQLRPTFESLRSDTDFATRKAGSDIADYLRAPLRPDGTRAVRTPDPNDPKNRVTLTEAMKMLRDEQQSVRSKVMAADAIEAKDLPTALGNLGRSWMTMPVPARQRLASRLRGGQFPNSRKVLVDMLKVETDVEARRLLHQIMFEIENTEDREAVAVAPGAGKGPVKGVNKDGGPFRPTGEMTEADALAAVANAKTPASSKATAIALLARTSPGETRSLALFRAALKHRHFAVRIAAARALGTIVEPANMPALLGALDDWCDDVRRAAARSAIVTDPDSEALLKAFAALTDDPSPGVSSLVNQVLADHGSQEAMQKLIAGQWSLSSQPGYRGDNGYTFGLPIGKAKARWTTEQFKAIKELPPDMVGALKTDDAFNRQRQPLQMIRAMGGVAHSAVPILLELARSSNDETRRLALDALASIARDDSQTLKLLAELITDPSYAHRSSAVDAFTSIGERALPGLPVIDGRIALLPPVEQAETRRRLDHFQKNIQNYGSSFKDDGKRYIMPPE